MILARRPGMTGFYVLACAGLLLHAYMVFLQFPAENGHGINSWSFVFYLWFAAPYLLLIVVQLTTRWMVGPLVAVLGVFVLNVWGYYDVVFPSNTSDSNTQALLILMPIMAVIYVIPPGLVLGWIIEHRIRKK